MTQIVAPAAPLDPSPDLARPAARAEGGLTLGGYAWALFEGARNPYLMLITIYIFMPYVARVMVGEPIRGQELISRFSQYSGWAVMLTAPLLGASVDTLGRRKAWLAVIVAAMVPLTASLWWARPDHTGLSVTTTLAIAAAVIADNPSGMTLDGTKLFSWSEVLHNSLLVRAVGMAQAHKASGLAVALGQLFALLALAFTAWAFALPGLPGTASWSWLPAKPLFGLSPALHEPERVVALLAAGIFAVGALPFFLFTRDAPSTGVPLVKAFGEGARALGRMVSTVGRYRSAAVYLVSRMFYLDGMTAILIYAGVYAVGVMHWGALEMLAYGVLLSVLGVVGGFTGRWLDATLGPKGAIQVEITMTMLGVVALLGMGPDKILYLPWSTALHAPLWHGPIFRTLPELMFLLVGFVNCTFIVAHYSSSRTMLTRLTPPAQSGAFFGVYALSGTATMWLGPTLVNAGTRYFKTQQGGFAMVLVLLVLGFIGLIFVKGGGRDDVVNDADAH